MKELKFRYISAKNFMCFGPEGIEIFFDDHGKVVLVKGLNLDTGTEVNPASNGAGKSSIQDIIAYGLYGKTVKKPKKLDHGTVINAIHKKKLEVVIEFNDMRILRGREPDKLKIWRSKDHIWDKDTDCTPGGKGEPQKKIDAEIGLSHSAFCSVVVFDDSNSYSFLELDAAGKRSLIENLLGLDRYKEHHENAKDLLKEAKANIKELTKEYERLQNEIDGVVKRIEKIEQQETTWKAQREKEAALLAGTILSKQAELKDCDSAAGLKKYEETQKRIEELNELLPTLEDKRTKVVTVVKEANIKLNDARESWNQLRAAYTEEQVGVRRLELEINKSAELVKSLERLEEGTKCPVCHGEISKTNFHNVLTHEKNTIAGTQDKINKGKSALLERDSELRKKDAFIEKLNDRIKEADASVVLLDGKIEAARRELLTLSKVQRPEAGVREQVLEANIVELKKQLKDKQAELTGDSPYKEILESAKQEKQTKETECETKTKDLRLAEKELPYYEFWVEAFGDKGIRRYVIDGIIPALNARIAYWMQYLIDAKIELTFDDELNETILVNGMETYYHAMSNGEKRRINLAVSQAFAYVMMLNSGSCPSVVFLDEITGGGIDRAGVTGIYNMIFELAKERQVFVTSHNETLLNMMQGCDSIMLLKKNGITKLATAA
jgi:DNA repair exonuclease SbcCD ATPase subunit